MRHIDINEMKNRLISRGEWHCGRAIACVLGCLIALMGIIVPARAASDWPMMGQNPAHTGQSAANTPATSAGNNQNKWVTQVAGVSLQATPIMSPDNTYVIVGTDDGRMLWINMVDGSIDFTGVSTVKTPFRGTPLLVPSGVDTVYDVYAANLDGRLYKFHKSAGAVTQPWGHPVPSTGVAPWGPLVASPMLVNIGFEDTPYILVPSTDGKIYLVDAATGAITRNPWFTAGGPIESTPALGALAPRVEAAIIADVQANDTTLQVALADAGNFTVGKTIQLRQGAQRVVVGKITAIDNATGTITFENQPGLVFNIGSLVRQERDPQSLFMGSSDGRVYSLVANTLDTSQRWLYPAAESMPGFIASPVIKGNYVYIPDRAGNLYALNADTGALANVASDPGITGALTTPALAGNYMYAGHEGKGLAKIDIQTPGSPVMTRVAQPTAVRAQPAAGADGAFVFAGEDGAVYCINADGTQKWAPSLTGRNVPVRATPILVTDPADANPVIIVATTDGYVICVKPGAAVAGPGTGKSPATSWSMYQREGSHGGTLNGIPELFSAPNDLAGPTYAANKLRWTVNTKGSVASTVAVARNGNEMRTSRLSVATTIGNKTLKIITPNNFYVGDILLLGDEYLGPITAITRAATDTVTVTYAPRKAHAANDEVWTSIYRRDTLRYQRDTLATQAAAGATTIEVNSVALFTVGDRLELVDRNTENDLHEFVSVMAIDIPTKTLTISSEATTDHKLKNAYVAASYIYAKAPAGATIIQAPYPERFLAGDQIILQGTQSEVATITSVVGNNLTLASSLAYEHTLESMIYAGQPGQWAAYVGGDDGSLRSINPETGKLNWRNDADRYLGAVRGAPAVDPVTQRVYVASNAGRLYAFAQHGQFLWAYPSLKSASVSSISSSPVLDEKGNIYFGTEGGFIYKVTPDGILAKKSAAAVSPIIGGLALYRTNDDPSDPATLRVIFGTRGGKLYSFDGNLDQKWEYVVGGAIVSAPVIDAGRPDPNIFVGDESGKVYAVHGDGTTVTALWAAPYDAGKPVRVSPAITNDTIYVGDSSGVVHAISIATPATFSTVTLDGGVTGSLTLDAGGNLLVSTAKGSVYCLDSALATKWQWNTKTDGKKSVALPIRTAPSLWQGDLVMVGCNDGSVYGIGPKGSAWNNVDQPIPGVVQAASLWPFFHRDARHLGSLDFLAPSEPGAQDPTLRWFSDHTNRLISSPVVSDQTPDRSTVVYQGSEQGYLFAHDAFDGTLKWQYPLAADDPIGAIRATPAVHTDGNIAVGALDGRMYLLKNDGTKIWDSGASVARGSFLASPVMGIDGTVYAVTSDTLHSSGMFSQGSMAGLHAGTAAVTLTGTQELVYPSPESANPLLVTRVRVRTKDGGQLYFKQGGEWKYYGQFDVAADGKARYLTVDLNREATAVKWMKADGAASAEVKGFEIYTSGTIEAATVSYTEGDDAATMATIATAPAWSPARSKKIVEASFAQAIWVRRIDVKSPNAYNITLVDANDQKHLWKQVVSKAGIAPLPSDTIPVGRLVKKIIWEKDSSDSSAAELYDFAVTHVNTTIGGTKAYALDAANGNILWQYPAAGYLPPATSSPVVSAGATRVQDIVYVANSLGSILALKDSGAGNLGTTAWANTYEAFDAVTASPVLVENPDGDDLFVADAGGDLHLLHTSTGGSVAGWPYHVEENFSTSAAVNAERQAYLVGDGGTVYLLNLAARDHDSTTYTYDTLAEYGAVWPAAPVALHDCDTKSITAVARIKANFSDDAGAALSAYRTDALGGQQVTFGLKDQDNPGYNPFLFINYHDEGKLVFDASVNPVKLPSTHKPGDALELAINLIPANASVKVTAYYRVADAGGNFSGKFTSLGSKIIPTSALDNLYPFVQGRDAADPKSIFTADVLQAEVFTGFVPTSLMTANGPLIASLMSLPTTVKSSPVIDSLGRVIFGTDSGSLYCLAPETGAINWIYMPDRTSTGIGISTTLTAAGNPGDTRLQVAGLAGFRTGDLVRISRPDGSSQENLGQVRGLSSPSLVNTTVAAAVGNADAIAGGSTNLIFTAGLPEAAVAGQICFPTGDPADRYLVQSITGNTVVLSRGATNPGYVAGTEWTFVMTDGQRVLPLAALSEDRNGDGVISASESMKVGDDVQVIPSSGPGAGIPQYLGRITSIGTKSVTLNTDISLTQSSGDASNAAGGSLLQFDILPDGLEVGVTGYITDQSTTKYTVTAVDANNRIVSVSPAIAAAHLVPVSWTFLIPFPVGSQVVAGPTYRYITVTRPLANRHAAGDVLSAIRSTGMPIRTSPAIGPGQTIFFGADDGILYALGPIIDPANQPELPALPEHDDFSPWFTFHRDNQRSGYSDSPGPLNDSLRWYRNTLSTLESSPALGFADATAPQGVLYVGTADEPDPRGFSRQAGSLICYDASNSQLRWRFNDDGNMGKILSSPAVFNYERIDSNGQTFKDELVVFGATSLPDNTPADFIGARLIDNTTILPDPIGPPVVDRIVKDMVVKQVRVSNPSRFRVGMSIYLTAGKTNTQYPGSNMERLGDIQAINGDWLVLTTARTITRPYHLFGEAVHLSSSQQGYLYCVDRYGSLRWRFPGSSDDGLGPIRSSPVVDAKGNIYFGTDDGVIYAVNAGGNEIWHYFVELPQVGGRDDGVPQITSSPALDHTESRLFVGVDVPSTNKGYVLALDVNATDDLRRKLWMTALNGPVTASPTVTRVGNAERIFIGSDNANGGTGTFYSLNPDDGAIVRARNSWPQDLANPTGPQLAMGPFTSTAAAIPEENTTHYAVTAVAGDVVTLDSVEGLAQGMRMKLYSNLGLFDCNISAVNMGAKQITVSPTPPVATYTDARTNEQLIIVGSLDGKLYAFTEKLDPAWSFATTKPILTSPAISTYTTLSTLAPQKKIRSYNVYVGSNDHFLYGLNFSNAVPTVPTMIWRRNLRDRLVASPVIGIPLGNKGRSMVYQASRDHYLYAFGDQTGYTGDEMNPDGPQDPWTPPEDNPEAMLIPSTVQVNKTVEWYGKQRPFTGEATPTDDYSWWKFTITLRNTGRGLVDNLKVYDNLPVALSEYSADPLLQPILVPTHIYPAAYVAPAGAAAARNDMVTSGDYLPAPADLKSAKFEVRIVAEGAPDKISWRMTRNGSVPVWSAPIDITGADQMLADGATVHFGSTTGHRLNDMWVFNAEVYETRLTGSIDNPWEIIFNNTTSTGTAGDGFTLLPDKRDPSQLRDEHNKTFVFYAIVGTKTNPYKDPDPLTRPNFGIQTPSYPAVVNIGDQLYLRLDRHPAPQTNPNELSADGVTYEGSRDNPRPVDAQRTTPVQNEWTDSFIVRMYYNGYMSPGENKTLTDEDGAGAAKEKRIFSAWNQQIPDTGEPLVFKIAKNYKAGRGDMSTTKVGLQGNSTIMIPLGVSMPRFDTIRNFRGVLDGTILPYAWRVTVQQGRVQMNQRVAEWGPQTGIRERTEIAKVDADAANTTAITMNDVTKIKLHHMLIIDNPTGTTDEEAFVTAIAGNVVTVARPVTVVAGAIVRDEWSPDLVVKNPIEMSDKTSGSSAPAQDIQLGDQGAPGHTATSTTLTLKNITSNWGFNPSSSQYRFMISPIDLMHPSAGLIDLNGLLALSPDYSFGDLPAAGKDWDAFRYDPYGEKHITVGKDLFDMPNGSALRALQSFSMHLTQRIPLHQGDSGVGKYQTSTEMRPLLSHIGGVDFVDLDNDGVYTAGRDLLLEDVNNDHLWDIWEVVYADLNNNGKRDNNEPALATGLFDMRAFIDMNGDRVWTPGEPYYVVNPAGTPDLGARDASQMYSSLNTRLGIAPIVDLQIPTTVADLGSTNISSPYSLPLIAPKLVNKGNTWLGGGAGTAFMNGSSTVETSTGSFDIANSLFRTGMPGTFTNGGSVTVRSGNEAQPLLFSSVLPSTWRIFKSPAGAPANYGSPFAVPITAWYRQPSGTYTGKLTITASPDGANWGSDSLLATLRLRETNLSQMAPMHSTPPDFDYSRRSPTTTPAINNTDWTNYLNGIESWPTGIVMPNFDTNNDLGVFVASNTPMTPAGFNRASPDDNSLIPTEQTDTNIWYRRVKHLVTEPTGDITVNAGIYTIPIPASYIGAVRATGDVSTDIVVLRLRPKVGVKTPFTVWYGQVVAKAADSIDVRPASSSVWNYSKDETVVEILTHAWVPVLVKADLDNMRLALMGAGSTAPVRCTQPSVTRDEGGRYWLVWTVSAVRSIKSGGQTNFVPVSSIAYKQFNPAAPSTPGFLWMNTPDISRREKPSFLYGVGRKPIAGTAAAEGFAIYEGGPEGTHGLYYGVTPTLAMPNWMMDNPLAALNSAFVSTARPQIWADSVNGAEQTSPISSLNIIFQGKRRDGNIDLYYSRLYAQVDTDTATPRLVLMPLNLTAAGPVTEAFTVAPDSNGKVYQGDEYLAWSQLTVKINGVDYPLVINDTAQEYTIVSADQTISVNVDPYQGIVKVNRGTVTSVVFTGKPRVQRLTDHIDPDVSPNVSVERWRYYDSTTGTFNYGSGGTLMAAPRVWIFWTRQHEDGMGSRVYYSTMRMHNTGTSALPVVDRLDAEIRDDGTATPPNVDMPERMLPMEVFSPDGSLFITRMSASAFSPEAGMWVLSTASRDVQPPYSTATKNQTTQHDLFLQVINVPVPEK